MRASRPWRMFAPLLAVLLLLAGWSLYWLFASAAARTASDSARQRLASEGIALACDSEAWGGYPFRFEFTCARPHLTLPDGSVSSQRLFVIAQAYYPSHLIMLLDGPTTAQGGSRKAQLEHGRAVISLVFEDAQPARVSAEIPDLRIAGLLATGRTLVHGRNGPTGKPELALGVESLQVTVPGRPTLLLDEASVTVTNPQDRSLDVRTVSLRQGSVKLWGDGRIGLDDRNRLAGKLATVTNDIEGLLKAASSYMPIEDQDRAAIKLLLGLFGKKLKADVVARDGQLFWGPLKLADLAPLY